MIHGGKMSKAHAQQFYKSFGLSKEKMQRLIQNEEARAKKLLEACQSTQELQHVFQFVDQGYLLITKWIQKMDELLSPDEPRHKSTYESLQATARASSGGTMQANSSEGIGNIGNTCYFNSAIQLLRVSSIGKFGSTYEYLCQISGDSIPHGGKKYPLPEATKDIRDNTLAAWKTLLHPTQTSSNHEASVRTILSQFPDMFPIPTQGDPGELITLAFMQVFVPDASAFESETGIDPNAHDFGYAIESSRVDVLDETERVIATTTKKTPVWMSSARASESVDEYLPEILPEPERLTEMNGSSSLNGHLVKSLTQRKTVTIIDRGSNDITLKDVKRTLFNRATGCNVKDTAHQNFDMDSLKAVIFHSGTATDGHYTSLRKVRDNYFLKISDSAVEELTREQADSYLTQNGHEIKMILQNNHAAHALEPSGESPPSGASASVGDALPGSVPEPVDRQQQQQVQRQLGVARQAFRSEVASQAETTHEIEFDGQPFTVKIAKQTIVGIEPWGEFARKISQNEEQRTQAIGFLMSFDRDLNLEPFEAMVGATTELMRDERGKVNMTGVLESVFNQLAQEKQLAFKPDQAATSIYANAEKNRLSTTGDGNCAFNGIALGLLNGCSVEQLDKLTCDQSILCKYPQRWESVPDPITGKWLKAQFHALTQSDGPEHALKLRRLQQSLAPGLRAWAAITVEEQWEDIKAQLTMVMEGTIDKLAKGIKLDDFDNDYLKWFGEGMMGLSDIICLKTPQQRQAAFLEWIEGAGKDAYLAALRTDGFNADSIALQALAKHLSDTMGTKVLLSSTTDGGFPPEFRWHVKLPSIFDSVVLTPEEKNQINNLYIYNLGDREKTNLAYKTDQELDSLSPQPHANVISGYKRLRNYLFQEPPINIAVWHSAGHWTYDLANSTNVVFSE